MEFSFFYFLMNTVSEIALDRPMTAENLSWDSPCQILLLQFCGCLCYGAYGVLKFLFSGLDGADGI